MIFFTVKSIFSVIYYFRVNQLEWEPHQDKNGAELEDHMRSIEELHASEMPYEKANKLAQALFSAKKFDTSYVSATKVAVLDGDVLQVALSHPCGCGVDELAGYVNSFWYSMDGHNWYHSHELPSAIDQRINNTSANAGNIIVKYTKVLQVWHAPLGNGIEPEPTL